ncbi:MAG: hypothetical protein FJW14_03925 [Acidimicrobiia bacterium]|nr:hypothetical protein [Acidimicrobiia bacterium]
MNYARVIAAGVVAFVVSMGVGFFVNEVLLADIYMANAAALRSEEAMYGTLPVGFVFLLVGFLAFAYAYAKGYEGGTGWIEGLRFGLVTWVIVTGFGLIWQWVLYPIDTAMATAIIVDSAIELAIYGAIVGAIYKPAASRASRPAAL